MQRALDAAWAIFVTLFGATFLTIAVAEFMTATVRTESPVVSLGRMAVFGVMVLYGGRMLWRMVDRPTPTPTPHHPDLYDRVWAFAEERGGRVTVVEVAAGCGLTAAEAERILDQFVVEKSAALRVTDDGVTVYELLDDSQPSA